MHYKYCPSCRLETLSREKPAKTSDEKCPRCGTVLETSARPLFAALAGRQGMGGGASPAGR